MNTEHFGRHRRKIMPAELPLPPGDAAGYEALAAYANETAAALHRHVLQTGEEIVLPFALEADDISIFKEEMEV